MDESRHTASWNWIASHGSVLVYVNSHREATIREIATWVDLTERRVMEILSDLRHAGLIEIVRKGRNNTYVLNAEETPLHPSVPISVADFLRLAKVQAA
jgi:DNA-binding IscR family transcriptional regulator